MKQSGQLGNVGVAASDRCKTENAPFISSKRPETCRKSGVVIRSKFPRWSTDRQGRREIENKMKAVIKCDLAATVWLVW